MTRVLIVDDAKFMRDKIREILETEDLQVAGEAENGEEAVLLYQELQPDLVIMDITMPVKNGIEALKDMIQLNPKVKVITCVRPCGKSGSSLRRSKPEPRTSSSSLSRKRKSSKRFGMCSEMLADDKREHGFFLRFRV